MSEPSIGHNSEPATKMAKDQLKNIVERFERLDGEIKGLRDDQKDILAEAKGHGYDVKALRRCIAIRRMDAGKHEEFESIVDTYMHALGGA